MKTFTTPAFLPVLCLIGSTLFTSLANTPTAQQAEYEALKATAERHYAEGSYALANELYLQADALDLSPQDARWVDFRMADTLWRSQAATRTTDSTKYEQARQQLEALIRDIQHEEDRDRVWAEVEQSLGDYWWMRREAKDWNKAWPHYQQALDWWAGATDIELARQRYIKTVWDITSPSWLESYEYYGDYGNVVPLEILDNVLNIAQTEDDKAHAHYLIAMTLTRQSGNWAQERRVPKEFEAALKPGKSTDWYDDALYYYGVWMVSHGRIISLENGQWQHEPDYVKALELFRRLASDYKKGETRYYDQAKHQIKNITSPTLGVSVSNIFLPHSEIQFHLNWRNVKEVDLAIYKVNLPEDVDLSPHPDQGSGYWMNAMNLAQRERVKSWSKKVEDKGDYRPGQERIRLDSRMPIGAYIIEARGGKASARDLILVTDASLVLKTSGKRALVYFCHALDGSPLAGAQVQLWERSHDDTKWVWHESTSQTNRDGIAVFDLIHARNSGGLFVSAAIKDRQAFSLGYRYGAYRQEQPWRIYAFTDRPAYRPGEEAQWKFVARRYNGSVYSTPSHQTMKFKIIDPRGSKVKEGTVTLNAFGSAWGSLELTDAMPLGEYKVRFKDVERNRFIGSATLFRLEEYKLPEFKVSVQTPKERGKKKAFIIGERVEVNVQADYYFGGPVANATVELLVYQNPFYHWWHPPRDYPWYYEDMSSPSRSYYGGQRGQIIKRETLKTDATGKARASFDTPLNAPQDFEYRIEARVTDASRREIIGSDMVRVTHQRYYVYPRPRHHLYRPQDEVTTDIKTLDANNQAVEVEGLVKVTRDYWYEIWLDPTGKQVRDEALRKRQKRFKVFPPPPDSNGRSWRLKFRGYQHDEILTRPVKTGAEGQAEFRFTPEREGYYRIAWTSQDKGGARISAEASVWVATNATTELGYRHGGLEIIVDKDTFRAGQKAPVMLHAPTNDRYVLFSIEGEDLYSYQLVHLTGTVKLIEVPTEEEHVPNIFLSAAMVSDRRIYTDTKQVIIPPVEHFLDVEVTSDREEYQPREEGTLRVTTRDHMGHPVAAEVALGLVDESVYSIQQEYAGDPRQFYYGVKRQQYIQTQSTFQQKSYVKLVEGLDNELIDEREQAAQNEQRLGATGAVVGGVVGGVLGGLAKDRTALPAARPVNARQALKMRRESFQLGTLDELAAMKEESAVTPPPPSSPALPGQEPVVQVRSDFRSTAFWQPDIITDENGNAAVKVKFPDSLTTWKATARIVTEGNTFGIATATVRTKKPLIIRLQAPRFFVVGDQVTVSAVINNNTDADMRVTPSFNAKGVVVSGRVQDDQPVKSEQEPVKIAANGEARVDWPVTVVKPGAVKVRVVARSDNEADAMEKSYTAYEHGIEKLIVKSGKVLGTDVTVTLNIPKERKPESTTMTVQVAPSMAVMMLDALPYLIDYPYGCTEQTMSRFLPTVVTVKTLRDLGLQPEVIMGTIFGGIERTYAGQMHRKGQKDLGRLDDMVKKGLDRLYDFQHRDGGWGWWKEGDSDHFMTAYVVWGLTLAQKAGTEVKPEVLGRGVTFLDKEIVERENHYDMQAWMLHALSTYHASTRRSQVGGFQAKAFEDLWTNRDKLNAYTRALLALSAHNYGFTRRTHILIRNLENGVKRDRTPDTSIIQRGFQRSHPAVMETAHWGEDGLYWRWSDGGVEATAFALRALLSVDPQNKLIEPVANWLIKNRRGAQWSNTRDTAITVLALNDYLRQSGELSPKLEYELFINGQSVAAQRLNAEDVLRAPSQFVIDPRYIRDGVNEIRIVRSNGDGPIYFSAEARWFSLEEPVAAAGNEIFVRRQYERLVGRPTLLKGYMYDKQPLNDGESITSGERVEVVMTIEAKNNYEYLVFEDLKPAGLEAVPVRSGEPLYARELKASGVGRAFANVETATIALPPAMNASGRDYTGRVRWVYQELRDRKVALFIDKLPEGVWEIRYQLRAEVPGQFHALPVIGYAMYVPEIRANGKEVRITVNDSR